MFRGARGWAPMVALVSVLVGACGDDRSTSAGVPVAQSSGSLSVQRQFVRVVQKVAPSVVQIRTAQGLGSGVVFDDRGDVVTNAHVVADATRVVVTLSSGASHPGAVLGRDRGTDLAVVRLEGASARPAAFADSSAVQVGDLTLAVGNPLGLRSTVTQGIVSAVGRTVTEGDGARLSSTIQTSAEINPGNSGGALVDISGNVIGIPTLAALNPEMGGQAAAGIGFAIDSNTVRRVANRLIRSGS